MRIQEGFVSQKISDKTVLVCINDNKERFSGMVELNDTAADIWKFISKGYTKEKVAQKLTEKYDVSYNDAMNAVVNMYKKLIDSGIATED